MPDYVWLMLLILLGVLFDYINGFHDTANAVAATVSTRALKPETALLVSAVFNFMGALSGTTVAATIGQGLVADAEIGSPVIAAAFLSAIAWNLLTWYSGLPSSSSHALIGALVGASLVSNGFCSVNWPGFVIIFLGLVLTPLGAMLLSNTLMRILLWFCRKSHRGDINNLFKKMQVAASCLASFAHGSNDAQKSMAIVTLSLLSLGLIDVFQVPLWVKLVCATAMSAGTAAGGKRIIRTLGTRIFKMEPINGFTADLSAGIMICAASLGGFPASTTHVVSSSIIGVGLAKRWKGVRLKVGLRMIIAWLLTIPACIMISAILYVMFIPFLL